MRDALVLCTIPYAIVDSSSIFYYVFYSNTSLKETNDSHSVLEVNVLVFWLSDSREKINKNNKNK